MMYSLQEISKFNDKFRKGEPLTLDYVKDISEYVLNNENLIKQELGKLKVVELKEMVRDSRYTRKDELVDQIYHSQVDCIYFFVSGADSITVALDPTTSSIKQQMYNKINKAFAVLTEEKLQELLKDRKESYEKHIERMKELEESIKNPKTLQDFESAKGIRKLTIEEQREYEELKATQKKEKLKEYEVKLAQKVASNGKYSISKTKDTRDNRDLWVVKFDKKSDDFKALNRQMKDLGGAGYSRFTKGFNFYFDPSEKLENIFKTEDNSSSLEENQDVKSLEKLRKVAENMVKEIDNKFADRLTNTARRANMAANAEREGEYLKKIQNIILNVVSYIESGKAKYLDKISAKTHIETLEDMLRSCKNKYIRMKSKEKYPNEKAYSSIVTQYEKELRESSDTLFNSIDVAEYPLTTCNKCFIERLLEETANVDNTVMVRRRLSKLLKNNVSEINTSRYIEDILDLYSKGKRNGKFEYFNTSDIDNYKRLQAIDIKDTIMLRAALREYYGIRGTFEETEEDKKEREIKEIERSLIGVKIPGYFPTPKNIVEQMLEYADIQEEDTILEPSAGSGHIADMIKEKYPNNKLDVVEFNYSLSQVLSKKGHNVIGNDFLTFDLKEGYDKIIMNPPFEKNQDVKHVLHAFSLLKPGGKIIAIMSEHPFFATDSQEFREWLENQEQSFSEKLPEGSFLESDRSTGVNTRIVIIQKPKINLYHQLLEDKIDIFDILKEGVSLNKYAAEFNTLYHKKILKLLENKDERLKEIAINYLLRSRYENIESVDFYEVGKIINSYDFNRESKNIKEPILIALKKLIKDDMALIKELVTKYKEIINETKIGYLKGLMLSSIKSNAKNLNIDNASRGAHYELFKGEGENIELLNKAVTLFNNLELDLIKASTNIETFKIALKHFIESISEADFKGTTIYNDFKMAVEDYLERVNEKYKIPSNIKNELFRYYLINRPPSIGTHPKDNVNIESFDTKKFVEEINREAWGFVDYNYKLTPQQIYEYELVEVKTDKEKREEAEKELRSIGVAYNGVKSVKIVPYLYETDRFNVEIVDNGNRFNTAMDLEYNDCIVTAVKELFNKNSKPLIVSETKKENKIVVEQLSFVI